MRLSSHLKSATKAITWRIIGAIDTFGLTFLVTGKVSAAVGVVGFEVLTKSVLYYSHERVWETSFFTSFFTGGSNA